MPNRRPRDTRHGNHRDRESRESRLRIIGGQLRGRAFDYDGHLATRPMKDRVREAVFNLIGPAVVDKLVIDLFAGTGALAFESLSRGARRAILIEQRFPTVRIININAQQLGLVPQVEVIAGDAFFWSRKLQSPDPISWLVFCCPPYDLFLSAGEPMRALLNDLVDRAPHGSVFVVECDKRFSTDELPTRVSWDVRQYPPAVVAIGELLTELPVTNLEGG